MATKGMWVVVDGLTVVADQGEDGGTVVVECANDEDDAKLFAAAPKMLAALRIFVPVVCLYLEAFAEDELMTLPAKLMLQDVEKSLDLIVPVLASMEANR